MRASSMASPTEVAAVGRDYCAVSERARTARGRQYQRSGLAACADTRGLSRVRDTIAAHVPGGS